MDTKQSCIFCKIAAGEIETSKVYGDEESVAIRDTNPQAPVHLLVIARDHIESLNDASRSDEGVLGHLLRVAARVANAEGLSESGYRTVINTGAGAGQSVFHLHLHIIGGRPLGWPPG